MQRDSQSELVDVKMGDRLDEMSEMICDVGQEYFQQEHTLMYDTLQSDLKKPLYPG